MCVCVFCVLIVFKVTIAINYGLQETAGACDEVHSAASRCLCSDVSIIDTRPTTTSSFA